MFRITVLLSFAFSFVLVQGQKKIVTTIEVDPFLRKTSADGYEGFIVDLMDAIAKKVGFEYEFDLVDDNLYGALNEKTGKWSGLMGEVVDKRADIAAAPLTVSAKRETYVDFAPFMNVGISVMMKKPETIKLGLMSFLEPFSTPVWLTLLLSYIVVSFILALIARTSPCSEKAEEYVEANSAGIAIRARSLSGRLAGAVWWLLTFILLAFYVANLAATLAAERSAAPIVEYEDLANQGLVRYGSLRRGATEQFFKNSTDPTLKRMWAIMSRDPSNFVTNLEDGVARVRDSNGKYAFLLESSMNDFISSRAPCDTYRVGKLIDSKSYAIATQEGSALSASIGKAVKELRDSGELSRLETKWWTEKKDCEVDDDSYATGDNWNRFQLTLSNLGGIFIVALIGLFVALDVLLIEIFFKARRENRSLADTLRTQCCGAPQA